MRPMEDIAIPLETILDMALPGLPTSERGLRRFVVTNEWPVVYAANGKYLVLTDAIPEPFGSMVRRRLDPLFRAPGTSLAYSPVPLASRRHGWEVAEARLMVIFEVFRRSLHVGKAEGIRGLAADAAAGNLDITLRNAINIAVLTGRRKRKGWVHAVSDPIPLDDAPSASISISRGSIERWIVLFNKYGADGLLHDRKKPNEQPREWPTWPPLK